MFPVKWYSRTGIPNERGRMASEARLKSCKASKLHFSFPFFPFHLFPKKKSIFLTFLPLSGKKKLQAVEHCYSGNGRQKIRQWQSLGSKSLLPNNFCLNKTSHQSCTYKILYVCLSPHPCCRNSALLIEENLHLFKNWLKSTPLRTDKRKRISWSHMLL